jgi:hypothetical protein
MFNLDAGTLSIDNSDFLHVKSERSRGVVELEPNLILIIRGWQAKATGTFVLESDVMSRTESKYQHYRCQQTFEKTTDWLRKNGVKSNEAMHFSRKLYGSLICDVHGIYAASRALPHADIAVTTRHYTSRTENVLPGLGSVLAPGDNVVRSSPPRRRKGKEGGSEIVSGDVSRSRRNPLVRKTDGTSEKSQSRQAVANT